MVKQQKTQSKVEPKQQSVRTIGLKDLGLSEAEVAENVGQEFATYIRASEQNRRQGTLGSKTRGEIAFSNKKPWRQKGTGRARCGSRRSPLWRKGGVIFGPQPRVRTLKLNKKVKRHVLQAMLVQQVVQNNVFALDWKLDQETPKTSVACTMLRTAGLLGKNIVLFVNHDDVQTHAAFYNLPSVRMLSFDQPNALDMAHGDCWVVLEKDVDMFKKMVGAWN